MSNKEIAKIVHEMFSLSKTHLKARSGNKKAALRVMDELTAEAVVLRNLGYMVGDSGRIKKFRRYSISWDENTKLIVSSSFSLVNKS